MLKRTVTVAAIWQNAVLPIITVIIIICVWVIIVVMVLLVLSSNKMHYHMRWEHCMIHCLPVRSLSNWTQYGLSVGNMMRTQTEKDTFLSLAPLFSLKSKSLPSGYHHNCWECSLTLCIFNADSLFLHDVSLDALLISSKQNWIQVYN